MNDESFHANHPFLFYIEDESTGTILYTGIVNNPLEETGIDEPVVPPQKPPVAATEVPSRLGEEENADSGESAEIHL